MSKPTDVELVVLKKFRAVIADLPLTPLQKTDLSLLAWLRARELNIEKADDMLRKNLIWRKENNMDSVLKWIPPEPFAPAFQYEICGIDHTGCPVIVIPFGRWDVRKAVDSGKSAEWLRLIDKIFHSALEKAHKLNLTLTPDDVPVTQFIIIADFAGYGLRQLTSMSNLQTIRELVSRFEANYPETLKSIFMINTPRIFSIFFAVLRPVLSARTLAKFQFFGTDEKKYIPPILKEIPGDQLPIVLGGTNKNICGFLSNGYKYYCSESAGTGGGLITTTIGAGEELKLEFDIRSKSKISWTFKTDNYDIGFSVLREMYADCKEIIQPYRRFNSHQTAQKGFANCEKEGLYSVTFDNTYSKFNPKTIHYMVEIEEPTSSDSRRPVELMH